MSASRLTPPAAGSSLPGAIVEHGKKVDPYLFDDGASLFYLLGGVRVEAGIESPRGR